MFRSARHYGELNGFDVIKLVALLAMIIDHAGYYLFSDFVVLRAVGRMAFPLFLFMVGYSGVWKFNRTLIIWAAFVIACAAATNHAVFPLDILVTIFITRFAMNRLLARFAPSPRNLTRIFVLCLLFYPFFLWFEYSTVALLFAICGYLMRHQRDALSSRIFLYCTMGVYFLLQGFVSFLFDLPSWVSFIAGLLIIVDLMLNVSLEPVGKRWLPQSLRLALAWAARNTLPLYGLHVMALMIAERVLMPARLPHFQWFSF